MKDKNELRKEWVALAPAWIKEVRKGKNSVRNSLLDPVMLDACGKVEGLNVLDCGCGEGRFCRMLAECGAKYVLGLDLCELMIEAAQKLKCESETYLVHDVHAMHLYLNCS
jgi:2-polyprenyl-3-methyl-5-hydroxy-6-metoxy-1,4-benzoquinol methylase